MAPSPSARLPRPTGRPRVPNAGPAKVLALWPAVALAPGRLAERVWHRQTRLDERFQAWGERPPLVTAVTNARHKRVPLLLCSIHHAGVCKLARCEGVTVPGSSDHQHGPTRPRGGNCAGAFGSPARATARRRSSNMTGRRSRGQCGLGDRTRADHQAGCLTPPVRAHDVPGD